MLAMQNDLAAMQCVLATFGAEAPAPAAKAPTPAKPPMAGTFKDSGGKSNSGQLSKKARK